MTGKREPCGKEPPLISFRSPETQSRGQSSQKLPSITYKIDIYFLTLLRIVTLQIEFIYGIKCLDPLK